MKLIVVLGICLAASGCVGPSQEQIRADVQASHEREELFRRQAEAANEATLFKAKMICNSYGYSETHPQFAQCQRAMFWDLFQREMPQPSSTILLIR